jgi:hypothetical protein
MQPVRRTRYLPISVDALIRLSLFDGPGAVSNPRPPVILGAPTERLREADAEQEIGRWAASRTLHSLLDGNVCPLVVTCQKRF